MSKAVEGRDLLDAGQSISITSAVKEIVRGDAAVNDIPLERRSHIFADVFLDTDVMRVAELALRE